MTDVKDWGIYLFGFGAGYTSAVITSGVPEAQVFGFSLFITGLVLMTFRRGEK